MPICALCNGTGKVSNYCKYCKSYFSNDIDKCPHCGWVLREIICVECGGKGSWEKDDY